MRKSGCLFYPDPGNIGGRTEINQIKERHIHSLKTVKSVIKISPPHPHVKRRIIQSKSIYKDPSYAMMLATYRTINNLNKGGVDMTIPKTFHLIKKLSDNKKKNNYNLFEHMKNIASLQRNFKSIQFGNVIFHLLIFYLLL